MQTVSPDSGRYWPQSLRITAQERRLLRQAADRRRMTIAQVLRQGLDPLFSELATRYGRESA